MLLRRAIPSFQLGTGFTKISAFQLEKTNLNNKPISQWNIINNFSGINSCLSSFYPYSFTTSKKSTKSPQKKAFKLKKTQMIPGQNIFLLYDGQKQQKSFQIVSALFILLFGLSLVKLYYTESDERRDDYIVMLVLAGSFIIYQKRVMKTLKRVTLNSKGDKLHITTFNPFGKGEKTMEAPVQIMTGVARATRFGGYMIKGGGKTSLYK